VRTRVRAIGAAAVAVWVMATSTALFKLIDMTMGLRVSRDEELEGLDLGEHHAVAYGDFLLKPANNME
jgi:Amt family ammonium transporter